MSFHLHLVICTASAGLHNPHDRRLREDCFLLNGATSAIGEMQKEVSRS